MLNSLANPVVRGVLHRLFTAADEGDGAKLAEIAAQYGGFLSGSASERAELFGSLYIPVSPETGRLLYSLIRASRPQTVVEFGTSFGIATIHLAAAVRDNGVGRVISTELNAAKAQRAREHLAEAGLADVVDIVTGDALTTLAAVPGPIGFALLDGWKELYLDMLRVIEPQLSPGALVAADDTLSFAKVLADYLSYVRDEANGYESVAFPLGDGVEVSCRT
ncbi:MAG TPA: class I SAM-dependent methyltransferase [Streptosporangiaceae bacterium]|nr:class I SAM-dependent methyltransferase [Streptosporangiaceae bacterium]